MDLKKTHTGKWKITGILKRYGKELLYSDIVLPYYSIRLPEFPPCVPFCETQITSRGEAAHELDYIGMKEE